MYEYDDDGDGEEGGRSAARTIGILAVVVVLALVGWFVVRPQLDNDDASEGAATSDTTADAGTAPDGSDEPSGSDPSSTSADDAADATTSAPSATTATTEPPATSTATTVAPPTTAAPTTTPTTAAPAPQPPTYSTLPDGTPQPILALFDVNLITITGAVPDQATKDRMQALAIANAKPGQDSVDNQLTIDPTVPIDIGVRVVELTSARFPPASADILPEHAAELNRVAAIMNALPHINVLVIGHADQRGEEQRNLLISAQRANAVVEYLAAQGISPSRLSSRAVGEADLLTLDNEPAALALNRRTEFVFYGLLVP